MHYTPIAGVEPEFPISATYRNTAPQATSPWAVPGDYTITLTVDGKSFRQPLTVAMDPRVRASAADLQEQFLSGREGVQIVGAHARLGHLYYLQGRYDDAIAELYRELVFLRQVDHALRDRDRQQEA